MSTGLPDVPIDPLHDDGSNLGLNMHAEVLAEFIENCATPMTIGIQGDWGSGKTSLMNLIKHRLTPPPTEAQRKKPAKYRPVCRGVWFNTWQYSQFSQENRLAISMLMNMLRELREIPNQDSWLTPETRAAFKRFAKGLLSASTMVVGSAVSGRVAGGAIDGEKLLQAFSGDDDLDEARLFEKMRADFETIVASVCDATKAEKVVFYVDDLDRLQPTRAIELLEVIKNFVDVPKCVYVLAIDYDVILRGLQQRKGYEGEALEAGEGKSFFDKIIQVPYRMPTSNYTSEDYFVEKFGAVLGKGNVTAFVRDNARRLIEASIGHNPRSIKRLLNLLALLAALAKNYRVATDDSITQRRLTGQMYNQLLVLTCIQMAYFRIYSLLARRRNIVDHVLVSLIVACGEWGDIVRKIDDDGGRYDADDEALEERLTRSAQQSNYRPTVELDPGAFETALDAVIREIRRMHRRGEWSERTGRNVRTLSQLLFSAIDTNPRNWKFDPEERKTLGVVLQLAAATSVEADDDEATSGGRPVAVNFRHLIERPGDGSLPLMNSIDRVYFADERLQSLPEDERTIWAMPEFEEPTSRIKVTFEGKVDSLRAATKRVFQRLASAGAEVNKSEAEVNINVTPYWEVRHGDDRTPLNDLIETYRHRATRQAEANGGDDS